MVNSSADFGQALCAHFGLNPKQVERNLRVNTADGQVFSVTLTIALTPADLAGIAVIMGAACQEKDRDA